MIKRPFVLFLSVVGILTFSLLWFIQSARFAEMVKPSLAKYLPTDSGISANFKEFRIQLFPPGIAVTEPVIAIRKGNHLGLPEGTSLKASRIELRFYALQMFSRQIRLKEIGIIEGEVQTVLPEMTSERPRKSPAMELTWSQLVKFRIDGVSLEDTRIKIGFAKKQDRVEFDARRFRVSQGGVESDPDFEIAAEVSNVQLDFGKGNQWSRRLDELFIFGRINSRGFDLQKLKVIDRFDGKENAFEATGMIQGDLMRPKALPFSAQMQLTGSLNRFLQLAGVGSAAQISAATVLKGEVKGDLKNIPESVRFDGTASLRSIQLKDWSADKADLSMAWNGAGGGAGELTVKEGTIHSADRVRQADLGASGGTIKIGKVSAPLGKIISGEPVTLEAPLELESAHVQWLGAGALRSIYPMGFRVSGKIDSKYSRVAKNAPASVVSKVALSVAGFQLDNQRIGKNRPLSRILTFPSCKLTGDIRLDAHAVRPEGLLVETGKSRFKVDGKVDFSSGYDLHALGQLDFDDIGVLAENKARGRGPLEVKIHGPASRVLIDFDANLQDTMYLNLNLGDLKGRITWDDDPQDLIFSNVQLVKGQTHYTGEGKLQVGEKELVNLNFVIGRPEAPGNIQDLRAIFDKLLEKIWWYPRSMFGPVTGKVKVSGGLNLDRLVIDGELAGNNWDWARERFRKVAGHVIFDKGRYAIEDLQITKNSSVISGSVSYVPDQSINWDVKTSGMPLSDFDHLVSLNVPIRGNLSLASSGKGKLGAVKSSTQLEVTNYSVRGLAFPNSQLNVGTNGNVATVTGVAAGGQGTLDAKYDFRPGAMSFGAVKLDQLDLSPLLLILNPKLIHDSALESKVSASANLQFKTGAIEFGSGLVEIKSLQLAKTGSSMSLSKPVSVKVVNGTFDLDHFETKGSLGRADLQLAGRNAVLDGSLTGTVNAELLEYVTPVIAKSAGNMELDFSIRGTIKEPLINGKSNLDGVYIKLASFDQPFENVNGVLQLRKNILSLQYINGDLAAGRTSATGTVELFVDRYPKLDIHGALTENKLIVFPFQFAKVRGKLDVSGTEPPYLVEGDITIDSALSKENVLNRVRDSGRKSVRFMPSRSALDDVDVPTFKLHVRAHGDKDIQVKNDLFDAELKGDVTLINTLESPKIIGFGEVTQGRLIFRDRNFQIQSGRVDFDNPAVIDPKFSMIANTEVGSTKIRLYAYGRMGDPKIELSSSPALQEREILSLLTLGFSTEEVSRLRSTDRGLVQQGEAASILLYSLDFNREVQEKTGLRFQVEEAVDSLSGTSAFRPQAGTETTAAPKIVVKRNIGKRVELSVGSTVGVGASTQRDLNAEVKVTPGVSVIGVWNAYEGVNAQDERTSYGLDLKLQKRFK